MCEKSCTLFHDTKVQLVAGIGQNQFYIFVEHILN